MICGFSPLNIWILTFLVNQKSWLRNRLSLRSSEQNKGDCDRAITRSHSDLEEFRKICPIDTLCMLGSLHSKYIAQICGRYLIIIHSEFVERLFYYLNKEMMTYSARQITEGLRMESIQ